VRWLEEGVETGREGWAPDVFSPLNGGFVFRVFFNGI
jgi:hypothetical protein